jgi:hypothetical protein
MREPEPVEAVPGGARLEMPGIGGSEPGSTAMTQATVKAAEVETSVRDVGRADVEKSRDVVEAPPEAGKEVVQPESQPAQEESQMQQDQPTEETVEAERGVVVPPSNVQAVAPTVETSAPPQGSISVVIDLTIDDPPSNKGKQKEDVEMVDAPDRPSTSATLGDDLAEASARWPDYVGLRLYGQRRSSRARVGRPSSSGTHQTPAPSPSSPSTTRMRCSTGSSSRDSVSTPCSLYARSRIPWCGVCRRLLR